MPKLLLLALWVACMALFCPNLFAEKKSDEIPVFGEIQFIELLQNPEERQKYEGKVIDLVGNLYSMNRPTEEKPKIEFIGFGRTYQTSIYRVSCQLSEPLTLAEFDRIAKSSFIVVRGHCSIQTKTKEVGSDVWYDFLVTLKKASIRFWEPEKPAAEGEK